MTAIDNPLLPQFVTEARDLLEQAGRALLALERAPGEEAAMNALFRAVHTLKGTSGLFEIGPFTRLVHAGEDLLGAAQAGRLAFTPALADTLLDMLDMLGHWVEALAARACLPEEAEALSAARAAALRGAFAPENGGTAAAARALPPPPWLEGLARPAGPLLAVTYTPDAHCFFRGEDPLGLVRQLPGLAWLRAEPIAPWPPLEALDPFLNNLRYLALARCGLEEARELFRYVPEQVEFHPLPGAPAEESAWRALLAAQRRLIEAAPEPDPIGPGRLAAARLVIARALEGAGLPLPAPLPEQAQGLLALIAAHLDTPAATGREEAAAPAPPEGQRPPANTILRVEQSKIDAMMNLIGELVVAKNGLAWLARRAGDEGFGLRELAREIKERHAVFNRISEEMQAAVMSVRMLPVSHVFQRFPRLVRDIARRLDKQVELVMEGEETEADKAVIESLADPLIHMVRNSLDHGIEPPAERLAAGKSAHGTLRLSASQENDTVIIRVADDGRGLDAETLRRKAVEKGLLEAERAAGLSDEEAHRLIFLPGFSTAAAVSDLSGRGVGMDVVRSAIENAGGEVRLQSRLGEGTLIEISLPLSMAVTQIMTVACGDRLFGVPMGLVVETVRVPRARMHRIGERDAFVLRERVVPVLRLPHLLDLPDDGTGPVEEEAVLVVRVNGERLGLVVGAFLEVMEAIVKPLEGVLAGLPGFAGTTLLGDGRVLLILDLPELLR